MKLMLRVIKTDISFISMRRQGFFGAAMQTISEAEYSGIMLVT